MSKIIRLTESDLAKLIKKVIDEQVAKQQTPTAQPTAQKQPTTKLKPVVNKKIDPRFLKLIGEILNNAAKGVAVFISPVFPKSLIKYGSSSAGRDGDYKNISFGILTPTDQWNQYYYQRYHVWLADVNKIRADHAEYRTQLGIPNSQEIGNLDYAALANLWNQGKIYPYFTYDGDNPIKQDDNVILPQSTEPGSTGVESILSQASINSNGELDIAQGVNLLKQLNPNIGNVFSERLKYKISDISKQNVTAALKLAGGTS